LRWFAPPPLKFAEPDCADYLVSAMLAVCLANLAIHVPHMPARPLVGAREQLGASAARFEAALKELQRRFQPDGEAEDASSAAAKLVGTWSKDTTKDMDEFLDKALGVGYLKRRLAIKAGQTQRITVRGGVVHLEMTDRRGTKKHEMHPHGRTIAGKGLAGLPCQRRVTWARDGTLYMEERYEQHLGGAEHGSPCKGDSCPLVRSHRGVKKSIMYVDVERELLSGTTVRMRTNYKRVGG